MASIIKLKRSSTPGAVPSSLEEGELAINTADQRLHAGDSSSVFTMFDGANELQKTSDEFGDRQLEQKVVTSVAFYANATSFVGGSLWNSRVDATTFNDAVANTNAFITSAFAVRDGNTFDPIYNLSLSSSTASEGDTISVAFAGTKLANGAIVPFTISGTVSNTDFRIIEQRPEILTSDLLSEDISLISDNGAKKDNLTRDGNEATHGEVHRFYPAKYGEQVTSGKWYVELQVIENTTSLAGADSYKQWFGWIAPNAAVISDTSGGGFITTSDGNWRHANTAGSSTDNYNVIGTWDTGLSGDGAFRIHEGNESGGPGNFSTVGLYTDLDGGEVRLYIDGALVDSSNTTIDFSSTGVTPFYASGSYHTWRWMNPDEYLYDITSTVGTHNRGWVGTGSLNGNRFNTLLMSANNAQANLKFEILSDGISEGSETLIITTNPSFIANTITIS